ncbi:DUF6678 family protein [Ruminococcus albus]|uniref:Uncharacterized protein n=1 Tax=Ruminococcus albus (strain ATCC 27210 / DSM 20455 / JCM 14654 / NCDO 2250 / 7) TaxID=697329 RepID=E6UJ69_RUMA7|nr:DUF6678 family protein [Ruminococcus albus]ADU23417.1 hypothetical protein Rumal_2951 [Ruminococcus albus 7 = DSM 20455]
MTADELKSEAFRAAQTKGLENCLSKEKWDILRQAMMNEMPFQPPYTVKFITDEEPCTEEINWYEAYLYEGLFNGAFALEWVKIRPCTQKVRGKLIAPEIIDAGKELEDILKKYSIPYEEENGVYCIYGYR